MSRVKQIVGIDLGSRNVRAVWLQLAGGRPKVVRTEKMELPLDSADTAELVGTWLSQKGLLNNFASVALQGTKLVFQPGQLAPGDPRTYNQAAEMELARFNDMVGDTMKCDVVGHEWRVEGKFVVDRGVNVTRRHYLMTLARPAVIKDELAALEQLRIRPTDLVPSPVALFCGLMPLVAKQRKTGSDESPTLFAEIGQTQTDIAVGTSSGILFARSFAAGGRQFTDALAKGGAVSIQQAENQKLRDGTLENGGPFSEFLTPAAERWYGQFSAAMAAYRGALPGQQCHVGTIILSGGGAELRGFREWLAEKTKTEVKFASELSADYGFDAGVFGLAIGLASVSLDIPDIPRISLIPPELRDEVVFREKKPFWIAAAITGALTLGVFTVGLVYSLGAETSKLETERQELRKREKIDKEIAKIRERNEAIRKQAIPLRDLLIGAPAARSTLSLIANSIAPEDWISLICDESTYMREEAPKQSGDVLKVVRPGFFVPGFRDTNLDDSKVVSANSDDLKKAPPASDFTVFIVEGYTPDMSLRTVEAMMTKIRSAASVRKVDLLSDDKVKPPAELPRFLEKVRLPEMRRFVVRLEVKRP